MPSNQSPDKTLKPTPSVIRIEPAPGTILSLLLLIAGLWVLNRLLPVVLVLVAALIIVGTIGPAVQWLEKRRIHRNLAIATRSPECTPRSSSARGLVRWNRSSHVARRARSAGSCSSSPAA